MALLNAIPIWALPPLTCYIIVEVLFYLFFRCRLRRLQVQWLLFADSAPTTTHSLTVTFLPSLEVHQ
jgi:hypothetical protein